MKSIYFAASLAVFSIVACNRNPKTSASSTPVKADEAKQESKQVNKPASNPEKGPSPLKALISDYLSLKNALTTDNANDAATAGKAMVTDFDKFDQSGLSPEQKKSYTEIADDAREMAEHIGKSADRLPHQREHFDMLSKDMYDLVKIFGAGQTLYSDHCPMYNNNKGANWLSETKTIKNPYLGKAMPDCGSLKEELN